MTLLPENILRLMSPADRAALGKGGVNKAEAEAKFIARSEKELQKLIAAELNRRGIWFHQAAMYKRTTGTVGTPDFLFAVNGVPVGLEVKYEKGRVRPEQKKAIEQMRANGWCCFVVYTFDEALGLLKAIT